MKKGTIIIYSVLLFLQLSGFILGDISATERAAIIALYESTDGDNWTDNSGWKTPPLHSDGFAKPGTEGNWYGVSVWEDRVTGLVLQHKNLNGTLPDQLGNLSALDILYLPSNNISGSIPASLGNLVNLETFGLYNNQLTGSLPSSLGNLKKLYDFSVDNNRLTGDIPTGFSSLTSLRSFKIGRNQMNVGDFPDWLCNNKGLWTIDLSESGVTGSIPAAIKDLSRLEWLDLHGNSISGSIPSIIDYLTELVSLDLSYNQISGSIPDEIGGLTKLRRLDLAFNKLSGEVPWVLGNLYELTTLSIRANMLYGFLPWNIINLKKLEYTSLDHNCYYTWNETIKAFCDSKDPYWELTQTIPPANVEVETLSSTSLKVTWDTILYEGWEGNGGYRVYYSISGNEPYTFAGMTKDKSTSSFNITGLEPGTSYWIFVATRTNPHGNNYNTCDSEYTMGTSGTTGVPMEKEPPFGSFDTPLDGSSVSSSIAVTGWALDDSSLDGVKIYRGEGSGMVYIGDAVFVAGARPDIAAAYPTYPNNGRAGWGYMLLTNFLPNGGNGTFTLYAVCKDKAGNSVTLGGKTIYVDNANAVKPFGAIDTPTQGGIASGSGFINWGWALTPLPNSLPFDGSTIDVWVDGVKVGSPVYNIYREDIATLFPGYANSDGAVGYFYLDTTAYENGLHTIQWTARDSAGNSDGIGSRYFQVQNYDPRHSQQNYRTTELSRNIAQIPFKALETMSCETGFNGHGSPLSHQEIPLVRVKELGRIKVQLGEGMQLEAGFLETPQGLKPLPVGSALNAADATFTWSLGPAFIGPYNMIFICKDSQGNVFKTSLQVVVEPK